MRPDEISIDKLADRQERLRQGYSPMFGTQTCRKVFIEGDPQYLETFAGQVVWATILNLVSRLYKSIDHICIQAPASIARLPHVFFPNNEKMLQSASMRLLSDLNNNYFQVSSGKPPGDLENWAIIRVGGSDDGSPLSVAVGAQGWLACVNADDWRKWPSDANPLGPIAAACLGTASLYRILHPLKQAAARSIVLSVFDHSAKSNTNPIVPSGLHLPRTYVAGVGAVGMATLMTLLCFEQFTSSDGLIAVDHDALDPTNLNRCIFAILADIQLTENEREKVKLAGRWFERSPLGYLGISQSWQQYLERAENSGERAFERILSCVDKYPARLAVQHGRAPRILLTAGTGDFALSVSRHILNNGLSCGLCYQSRKGETSCGEASTGLNQAFVNEPEPSIGFVSVLAGCLLAAEHLKEIVPEWGSARLKNSLRVKTLYPSAKRSARQKDPACNCSSRFVAMGYEATWGKVD